MKLLFSNMTKLSDDCSGWWSSVRLASLVPSIVSVVLRLVTFAMAFEFARKAAGIPGLTAAVHPDASPTLTKRRATPPASTAPTVPQSYAKPPLFSGSSASSGSESDGGAPANRRPIFTPSRTAGRPAYNPPRTTPGPVRRPSALEEAGHRVGVE